MDAFCSDAYQIKIGNVEKLQLNHIDQYEIRVPPKKKVEFIKDIFSTCALTQAIIFINTKDFCEKVHNLLRSSGYKSTIIFGEMSKEERDEMMRKFRNGEVNVIITTNLLARGVDVPELEIVINFDIPIIRNAKGEKIGDPENYMHRIGRTGRFGTRGMAVNLYDRDEDKTYLD